ncbi:LytTR family DNA-binding domain-containing protein [Gordonibacter sp. Marseille-P4307]|uniref:LytTR family DNA-binding domain-containing protein n=1 Tax=Gordonibacter sp. Marseille-P4307 TaxID=2161815 RepID=UPI000F5398BF|nr:LytTR family DNA-binding domain-containing protein [Gordonibacter sp. Marseille-P4307]
MKITIDERPSARDIEITILCAKTDREVLDIVARLRMHDRKVTGYSDGQTRIVSAEDVLYIESIDGHTFFYTNDSVLETRLRLCEMEERFSDCDFMRIAKNCVVNFRKITGLSPDLNGRMLATLENSERIVISRQYASQVRRKIGIM